MKSVKELVSDGLKDTKITILVFGPQIVELSSDEKTRKLQDKRVQIRKELESLGHFVRYAEDVTDNSLPEPFNNMLMQEILIMNQYELIINLIESNGTVSEATLIALKPEFAKKSTLFINSDYEDGFTVQACRLAEFHGAEFNTYEYPNDLDDCNLLGFIMKKVEMVQFVKMVS
ncbi:hypothetical protein [Flagellimonas sp. 2504JD4-2]